MRFEFDIFDTQQLIREAEAAESVAVGTPSVLDAYFASLESCPRIAPERQVTLAGDYQREVATCRDQLDRIPGKVLFLTRLLEGLLNGERWSDFFLPQRESEQPTTGGSTERSRFFKRLEQNHALKNPNLRDWSIRPNLLLAWNRELLRWLPELPQRPWFSRILPGQHQPLADLEYWAGAVRDLEAMSGLRINELAARARQLRPHVEQADELFATLVQCNLRLVIHIARKFQHRGVALEDLIQEGNLGLMKSVERFNPQKGFNLSTYAVCWIKESILRALLKQGHLIQFPPAVYALLRRIQKIREAAEIAGNPEPTMGQLAGQLQTSQEHIEAALALHQVYSLHRPVPWNERETFEEMLVGEEGITCDERDVLRAAISQLLGNLAPKEKQVLRLRYGLGRRFAQSVDEVATALRLTRERVRQIEAKAITKLQADPDVQSKRLRFLAA